MPPQLPKTSQITNLTLYLCIALFAAVHVLDLVALPFAVMSDSFAYVSWGLDVTNVNSGSMSYSFEPRYQDFPYFPLGYPLIIGTIALINRVATFDLLYALQHSILVISVGLALHYLRSRPVAFWVFFGLALLAPEMHSYPQTIMSEGIAMSLHLIVIVATLFALSRPSKKLVFIALICAFFVTLVRGTPLLQIPIWCAVVWITTQNRCSIAASAGAAVAGAVLIGYTYAHTGYVGLTTSDGFHLHNRLVFSQNLPLHLNPAEKTIVDAIGEETYRRPHWFVVDALYKKLGMQQGPKVNQLLAEASKPYITLFPFEYLKNTFVLCFKSLRLNNDILLDYTHGWPIEAEAKSREIRTFDWWYSVVENLPGMRGNLIGPIFMALFAIAAITLLTGKLPLPLPFYLAIGYAALGLFIASSLSLDDYRRVREYFPVIIFAAALTIDGVGSLIQGKLKK